MFPFGSIVGRYAAHKKGEVAMPHINIHKKESKGHTVLVCGSLMPVLGCALHGIFYPQLVGHVCPECLRSNPAIDWSDPKNWPWVPSPLIKKEMITHENCPDSCPQKPSVAMGVDPAAKGEDRTVFTVVKPGKHKHDPLRYGFFDMEVP